MIKFLLLSLEKRGNDFNQGTDRYAADKQRRKKCLGNKHVIVMFEDMLFHEPVADDDCMAKLFSLTDF